MLGLRGARLPARLLSGKLRTYLGEEDTLKALAVVFNYLMNFITFLGASLAF